jgi:hypothetical protein
MMPNWMSERMIKLVLNLLVWTTILVPAVVIVAQSYDSGLAVSGQSEQNENTCGSSKDPSECRPTCPQR